MLTFRAVSFSGWLWFQFKAEVCWVGKEEKTSHSHMSSLSLVPSSPLHASYPPHTPFTLAWFQANMWGQGWWFVSCCNKWPQTKQLKRQQKQRNVLSYSSGGQNPKSRCQQDHTLSKALGKDPSMPPPALSVSLLVTASIQCLPLSPRSLFPCVLIKSPSSCQEHQLLDSGPTDRHVPGS